MPGVQLRYIGQVRGDSDGDSEDWLDSWQDSRNDTSIVSNDRIFTTNETSIHNDDADPRREWDQLMKGDIKGGIGIDILAEDGTVIALKPSSYYKYWTNGIISWGLASTAAELRPLLLKSISEIESKTCIRFQERTQSTPNYIWITAEATGCWSYVGMYIPGNQMLNLQKSGCWYEGIVTHELLHAIGFYHEHQRPDRDDYITVNLENTISGASSQFTKFSGSATVDTGTPYNYQSIMHYDLYAFGRQVDGEYLQTIFPKQSGVTIEHVAYRPKLTAGDAQQINRLYASLCQARTSTPSDLEDSSGGSVAGGTTNGQPDGGSSQDTTGGSSGASNRKFWTYISYLLSLFGFSSHWK